MVITDTGLKNVTCKQTLTPQNYEKRVLFVKLSPSNSLLQPLHPWRTRCYVWQWGGLSQHRRQGEGDIQPIRAQVCVWWPVVVCAGRCAPQTTPIGGQDRNSHLWYQSKCKYFTRNYYVAIVDERGPRTGSSLAPGPVNYDITRSLSVKGNRPLANRCMLNPPSWCVHTTPCKDRHGDLCRCRSLCWCRCPERTITTWGPPTTCNCSSLFTWDRPPLPPGEQTDWLKTLDSRKLRM